MQSSLSSASFYEDLFISYLLYLIGISSLYSTFIVMQIDMGLRHKIWWEKERARQPKQSKQSNHQNNLQPCPVNVYSSVALFCAAFPHIVIFFFQLLRLWLNGHLQQACLQLEHWAPLGPEFSLSLSLASPVRVRKRKMSRTASGSECADHKHISVPVLSHTYH